MINGVAGGGRTATTKRGEAEAIQINGAARGATIERDEADAIQINGAAVGASTATKKRRR